MIIWSGWGILVPVYAVIGLVLGVAVGSALPPPWSATIGPIIAGLAAGAAIWFTAKKLDGRPGRVLLDEATGQRIELRKSAGSFFFVPTRYWAFVLPLVGLAMGLLMSQAGAA